LQSDERNARESQALLLRTYVRYLWTASVADAMAWRAALPRRSAVEVSAAAHSCASAQLSACARCVAASAIDRNACTGRSPGVCIIAEPGFAVHQILPQKQWLASS